MQHYLVISADCHAGPNAPAYREFLDPSFRADFDDELAERQRLIDERHAAAAADGDFVGDTAFQEEWFGEDDEGNSLHDIGLRGGWDAATRDRELDRDGVTAEVVFPGPDAVTGTMGAPFGAGFNPVVTHSPDHLLAGARAYNRWAANLCGSSPERRAGLIVAPILDDLDGAVAEIRRAHADGLTGGVIIPPRWDGHESYTSYRYDAVWSVCEELQLPVHCHSGPAPREDYGEVSGWMSVYGYETVFFTARPLWFMLLTGVFERFPDAQDGGHGSRLLLGRRPAVAGRHDGDARARHAQDGEHARHPQPVAERILRPEREDRRVEHAVDASSVAATRSASATSCGGTTSRTPRARGPTRASSSRTGSGTSRSTRPNRSSV